MRARPLPALLLLAAAVVAGIALDARRGGSPPSTALAGQVVRIHDGDTLSFRAGAATQRVRLAQIDAPERGQPWGRRAHQALARLAEGREARLVVLDRDDYGRTVGDLYVGEELVNESLVRGGHAWAYRRHLRSPAIAAAEDEARSAGRGLWGLPPAEREPPWEWRRKHPR